jgi:hypothetical protein
VAAVRPSNRGAGWLRRALGERLDDAPSRILGFNAMRLTRFRYIGNSTAIMTCVYSYDHEDKLLPARAKIIAGKRDVLYHGTRYLSSILAKGCLCFGDTGDNAVCFTRSADEAAYWAEMPRDDDEGYGAILIFDRKSLKTRYAIEPIELSSAPFRRKEKEERVRSRDVELGPHLIGLVAQEKTLQSPERRRRRFVGRLLRVRHQEVTAPDVDPKD